MGSINPFQICVHRQFLRCFSRCWIWRPQVSPFTLPLVNHPSGFKVYNPGPHQHLIQTSSSFDIPPKKCRGINFRVSMPRIITTILLPLDRTYIPAYIVIVPDMCTKFKINIPSIWNSWICNTVSNNRGISEVSFVKNDFKTPVVCKESQIIEIQFPFIYSVSYSVYQVFPYLKLEYRPW